MSRSLATNTSSLGMSSRPHRIEDTEGLQAIVAPLYLFVL